MEPLPFDSLSQVVMALEKQSLLRGRFILLPNVTDRGTKTLLRSGMAPKYSSMPCVGGYVDGAVIKLGIGNRRILDGLDSSWGNKPLAVFQTSDSRREDHRDLGTAPTWIKWALPTAEALRQACLARKSRISVGEPPLPSTYIRLISVSNSRFLGPLVLELNPQYSALIGGRGTGKSTVLEYLRWALCDQPLSSNIQDEVPDYAARRESLIAKTLHPLAGTVEIHLVANGVQHVVRRSAADGRVLLKIGDGGFQQSSDAEVRHLLPVQAYSQKQLSSVAVRVEELTRFLEAPGKADLASIDLRFDQLAVQIRELHALRLEHRLLARTRSEQTRELDSLRHQADAIRSNLTGLSASDQAVISLHGSYQAANEYVSRLLRDLAEATEAVAELERELSLLPRIRGPVPEFEGSGLMRAVEAEAGALLRDLHAGVLALKERAASVQEGALATRIAEWRAAHSEFIVKYEAAKTASRAHDSRLAELSELKKRIAELAGVLDRTERELDALGDPQTRYDAAWQEWKDLHHKRHDILDRLAADLSELSGGLIRATLVVGGDGTSLVNRLKEVVRGSGVHTSRVEEMVATVLGAKGALDAWLALVHELEQIALWDPTSTPDVPVVAAMTRAGIGVGQIRRLGERLTADLWLDFALHPVPSVPVFQFRTKESEYIPFADASAGQQATALVRALLNQEGPPLLIDQPEDDLDNQVILEVAEDIWRAKARRQLVFASHNANLVVNGDADLVIAFGYRISGDASGGKVLTEGAIDVPETNDVIKRIMEGGEEAFKMRQAKYGF